MHSDLPRGFHPEFQDTCPCCGYETLSGRSAYDICPVCWWEDDGQDNDNGKALSGPNQISLNQGRFNFLKFGIYDPERNGLRKLQKPVSNYTQKRFFRINSGKKIEELDEDRKLIYQGSLE